MIATQSITQTQIQQFVEAWFRDILDIHAPIDSAYDFLADEGLSMQFPDGDIHDFSSFKVWYDRVTNLFFDENHNLVSVEASIAGDRAVVDIVVAWQASWWQPPAAKSKRTSMNATQRWTVQPSHKNPYGLEILTYNATVKPFQYAPGFAQL